MLNLVKWRWWNNFCETDSKNKGTIILMSLCEFHKIFINKQQNTQKHINNIQFLSLLLNSHPKCQSLLNLSVLDIRHTKINILLASLLVTHIWSFFFSLPFSFITLHYAMISFTLFCLLQDIIHFKFYQKKNWKTSKSKIY